MRIRRLGTQRPPSGSGCWVFGFADCDRFPNCDRCSTIEKAVRAATSVKRNWVEIQTGTFPRRGASR